MSGTAKSDQGGNFDDLIEHGSKLSHGRHSPASLLSADDAARGINGARKAPVGMLPSEIIRIETAMYWAGVGDKTIREWAKRDGIGRQAEKHSPLQISMPALLMKADGAVEALERLRAGDRAHPAVQYYLVRAVNLQDELRLQSRSRKG